MSWIGITLISLAAFGLGWFLNEVHQYRWITLKFEPAVLQQVDKLTETTSLIILDLISVIEDIKTDPDRYLPRMTTDLIEEWKQYAANLVVNQETTA